MSDVARYEYFLFLLLVILALERLARRLARRLALPPAAAFILGAPGWPCCRGRRN